MDLWYFVLILAVGFASSENETEVNKDEPPPKTLEDLGPPQELPEMCPEAMDEKNIPYFEDPYDCNCYYMCDKWRRPMRMCCHGGLWWHPISQTCYYKEQFPKFRQEECELRKKMALRAIDTGSYSYFPDWLREKLQNHKEELQRLEQAQKQSAEDIPSPNDIPRRPPTTTPRPQTTPPVSYSTPGPSNLEALFDDSEENLGNQYRATGFHQPQAEGIQIVDIPKENPVLYLGEPEAYNPAKKPEPIGNPRGGSKQGPMEDIKLSRTNEILDKNNLGFFDGPGISITPSDMDSDQPRKITIHVDFPSEEEDDRVQQRQAAYTQVFQTHAANQPSPPWMVSNTKPIPSTNDQQPILNAYKMGPPVKQHSKPFTPFSFRRTSEPVTLVETKIAPEQTHLKKYAGMFRPRLQKAQPFQHKPQPQNFQIQQHRMPERYQPPKQQPSQPLRQAAPPVSPQQQLAAQPLRQAAPPVSPLQQLAARKERNFLNRNYRPPQPQQPTAQPQRPQHTQHLPQQSRRPPPPQRPHKNPPVQQFMPQRPTNAPQNIVLQAAPAPQNTVPQGIQNTPQQQPTVNAPQAYHTQNLSPSHSTFSPPMAKTLPPSGQQGSAQYGTMPKAHSPPPSSWPVDVSLKDVKSLEQSYANYYINQAFDRSADSGEAGGDIAGAEKDDLLLEKSYINTQENTVEDSEALSLDRYYANLPDEYIYGHCTVQPNPANQDLKDFIWGSIDLRQSLKGGETELRINMTGFNQKDSVTQHGFHVHEYGDLSAGCESAGSHYDPFGVVHGGPGDDPRFRHFGDLGNVTENANGEVVEVINDLLVSLLGPFSVLGRAIVIHEKEDDLGRGQNEGSLLTGNAGSRLACCTIGLSNGTRWADKEWNRVWEELAAAKVTQAKPTPQAATSKTP